MSMEHPKTISLLLEALQGLRRIEAMLRPMLVPKPEPIGRLLGQVVGGVESPARGTEPPAQTRPPNVKIVVSGSSGEDIDQANKERDFACRRRHTPASIKRDQAQVLAAIARSGLTAMAAAKLTNLNPGIMHKLINGKAGLSAKAEAALAKLPRRRAGGER